MGLTQVQIAELHEGSVQVYNEPDYRFIKIIKMRKRIMKERQKYENRNDKNDTAQRGI